MAATSATEATDGPVMTLINKRIRNLRKKYKRIIQIEEAVAQGKPIIKEQEDVLHSKPGVCALIDELEKLRNPISVAVDEEIELALQRRQEVEQQSTGDSGKSRVTDDDGEIRVTEEAKSEESDFGVVEDLLNLLYFGSMFDVKTQNDFTSMMITRSCERGCCLTYDCVTDDDAVDLLGERDLDLISMLGGLVISRPVDSSLSHKDALQRCIEHAKCWIAKSNQPIESDSSVTYAELRERLTKIMATDYFTTTPEMKAPGDVAAAAGNYASFQVSGHASMVLPVQVEGSVDQYQPKDDDTENLQGHEAGGSQPSLEEELQKEEFMKENLAEVSAISSQHAEAEEYQGDAASKEQQYNPRRIYPNQRSGRGSGGGGGGRRGYSNGRGGRSSGRGVGPYQNGRNQYNDQPANYYPRNYYNIRGRGGRGGGGHSYNNHDSAGHASSVDVGSAS